MRYAGHEFDDALLVEELLYTYTVGMRRNNTKSAVDFLYLRQDARGRAEFLEEYLRAVIELRRRWRCRDWDSPVEASKMQDRAVARMKKIHGLYAQEGKFESGDKMPPGSF